MRFRAIISNENLVTLVGVTSAMEKIGSATAVYLDEDFFRLSIINQSPDSPKVYSELRKDTLFTEYRIESQSNNTILFEIELDLLTRALTSGKNAAYCYLKLIKRGNKPCLCFETRVNINK